MPELEGKWILTIRDTEGQWAGRSPRLTLHDSPDEAGAELEHYVQANWASKVGGPAETEDPVAEYFDGVPERYDIAFALLPVKHAVNR